MQLLIKTRARSAKSRFQSQIMTRLKLNFLSPLVKTLTQKLLNRNFNLIKIKNLSIKSRLTGKTTINKIMKT